MVQPKRPKKKKLFDHFADATKIYDGPCRIIRKTKSLQPCPTLAAILAVHTEDQSRPGFDLTPMFQMTTGKMLGPRLVYFVRRSEYIEVEHCPFCGNRVTARTRR